MSGDEAAVEKFPKYFIRNIQKYNPLLKAQIIQFQLKRNKFVEIKTNIVKIFIFQLVSIRQEMGKSKETN